MDVLSTVQRKFPGETPGTTGANRWSSGETAAGRYVPNPPFSGTSIGHGFCKLSLRALSAVAFGSFCSAVRRCSSGPTGQIRSPTDSCRYEIREAHSTEWKIGEFVRTIQTEKAGKSTYSKPQSTGARARLLEPLRPQNNSSLLQSSKANALNRRRREPGKSPNHRISEEPDRIRVSFPSWHRCRSRV